MKKFVGLVLALILICSFAVAEVDLTGMTFDELIELRQKVDAAIFASDGWQEVSVPAGIYKIGEDIPAGKWVVTPVEGSTAHISLGENIEANGMELASSFYYEAVTSESDSFAAYNSIREVTLNLQEGTYVEIVDANVIFTPFKGHNLGFK